MSLFDFTTPEAQEEIHVKEGFVAAKPGINKFELKDIELKENNDLVFQFKGITDEERGGFSVWINASKFDEQDPNYKGEKQAQWTRNQVVHIVKAFLTDAQMEPITGVAHNGSTLAQQWASFARSIAKNLTKDKYEGVEAMFKLLIHFNDDIDERTGRYKTQIPLFPKFISTAIRPFALNVNDKIDPTKNNGLPFERIKPLSEYNIQGTDQAPQMSFGTTSEAPTGFGQSNPAPFGQ